MPFTADCLGRQRCCLSPSNTHTHSFQAAYGSGTLGNAHICNQELADEMSSGKAGHSSGKCTSAPVVFQALCISAGLIVILGCPRACDRRARDGLFRLHAHVDAHFCWLSASVPLGCPPPSSLAARICEFRDQYYVAPRMVIAGAGMKHDVLLDLSEKYFGGVSPGPATPIVDEPAEVCDRRRCACPSINGAHGKCSYIPLPCKGPFWVGGHSFFCDSLL